MEFIESKNAPLAAPLLELDAIDLRILTHLQADTSQSNQLLAERVHVSPPTCLRRVKRLVDAGVIERQIAILSPDKLKTIVGYGLTAVVEVTLTQQDAQTMRAFEQRITTESAVQQCQTPHS